LRRRLDQLSPDSRPGLHRRASAWYEQNGFADEATDHALRAGDFERVARLIEEHVDAIWQSGEHTKLWRWLEALPAELLHSSPDLCVFFAWNLYVRGRQDAAEQSLQAAEQALDVGADLGDQSQVPDPGREKVRGRIAVIRALLAFFRGDVPAIIRHARQALKVLPESDSAWRSSAAISLGDAYRIQGDITEAYRARLGALEISQAAGNVYMILIASMKLAVNMRQQGRLAQVKGVCEQQLQLAKESGLSHTAVAGGFLAIGGEVQAELDDLAGALDRSRRGVELAESGEDMVVLGWSYLCLMRVLLSSGDLAVAQQLAQKVGHHSRAADIPPWIKRMMAGWQARLWLAQGEMEPAARWVAERGLDADGELQFLHEFEHIVLARILMAQGRLDEAVTLLHRLCEAAETAERISSLIEILILQSLALEAQGNTDEALRTLERALVRAEPGGFVRILVDEGPPMARLLYEAAARGIVPDYARRLLSAFPLAEPAPAAPSIAPPQESELIEPLSERELEVLQLIAQGLTNPEIASRLFVAVNTVKSHTRNIYGKLGVHNRTKAVARARALGILPSI
jgi:LuxR family maltose regulon positive regulatory protein